MERETMLISIASIAILAAVMLAGCTGDQYSSTKSAAEYEVRIDCQGEWSGSYSDVNGVESIHGKSPKTIPFPDAEGTISVFAQMEDDAFNSSLIVEILKNGEVVKSASTTAAYGDVSISYTL